MHSDDEVSAEMSVPLERITCLRDYESLAKQALPSDVWAYLNAGAADGITHRWNQEAFHRVALLPRMLRPASGGSAAVELFGQRHAHPILVAPMAYHRLAHADAELATAVGASAMKAGFVVSTQASVTLEEIARQAQSPLWFQLYIQPDRDVSLDLIRRAERAGYQAIVMTVDSPIQGLRNEDQRQGFRLPVHIRPVNLDSYTGIPATAAVPAGGSVFEHALVAGMAGWDDVAWLLRQTSLPVLLKGILHPQDVQSALDAGARGIIVSNHGGRALDGVPAALDVLPGIAAQVDGRVPVLADGGIRRGTDVFKMLALGADAVLVGRPVLHGLAVAGATGVAHVLNILRTELETAMVLASCRTVSEIDATRLLTRGENHGR